MSFAAKARHRCPHRHRRRHPRLRVRPGLPPTPRQRLRSNNALFRRCRPDRRRWRVWHPLPGRHLHRYHRRGFHRPRFHVRRNSPRGPLHPSHRPPVRIPFRRLPRVGTRTSGRLRGSAIRPSAHRRLISRLLWVPGDGNRQQRRALARRYRGFQERFRTVPPPAGRIRSPWSASSPDRRR